MILVEDFSTPFSITDTATRPKISKDIEELNKTIRSIQHPRNTPSNKRRINTILKCPWNICQDRPYPGP